MRRNRGMTLLELMVVVAILGVLSSLGFISSRRLKANYDLTEATNKLYSHIEWIRQRSMGSAYPYGIKPCPGHAKQ
jgi:prepilin-type N-terminal cleavage/methylation domain-containing protein